MRLRARDHYTSSTLIGRKGGAGPSLLHTTLDGPTEYISKCKMDVKSTWIPTWRQPDHVFMVTCFIILEVGLTQSREVVALQIFILFYHVWGHARIEIHGNCIWLKIGHIWLHTTLEGPWPHSMLLGVSRDGLWTLLFGLSQSQCHNSWLVCEVA